MNRASVLVLSMLLFCGCATTVTDPSRSIDHNVAAGKYRFPDQILDFERSDVRNYEAQTKGAGYGIGYSKAGAAKINMYFYTMGLPAIPEDISAETIVNDVKTSARAIREVRERQGAVTIVVNDAHAIEIGGHPFWECRASWKEEKAKHRSFLLITSLRNAMLKIRITFDPIGDSRVEELYQDILEEIAEKIVEPNQLDSQACGQVPLLPSNGAALTINQTEFPVPGGGFLSLPMPASLKTASELAQDDGQLGILFQPLSGPPYHCLVIVVQNRAGEEGFGQPAYLKQALIVAGRDYVGQNRGQFPELEELTGGPNPGFAFSITDEALVGKPPVPNDFPYFRQGIVSVDNLLLTYSIFMHHAEPDPVAQIEHMLVNAAHISEKKGPN